MHGMSIQHIGYSTGEAMFLVYGVWFQYYEKVLWIKPITLTLLLTLTLPLLTLGRPVRIIGVFQRKSSKKKIFGKKIDPIIFPRYCFWPFSMLITAHLFTGPAYTSGFESLVFPKRSLGGDTHTNTAENAVFGDISWRSRSAVLVCTPSRLCLNLKTFIRRRGCVISSPGCGYFITRDHSSVIHVVRNGMYAEIGGSAAGKVFTWYRCFGDLEIWRHQNIINVGNTIL